MYFTALTFDLHSPMTYRFLNNPECAHAEILSLFPDGSPRPLFRIDDAKDGKIVYMVSQDMPDVNRWNNRFAIDRNASLCRSASYDRFLETVKNGDVLNFKITAAPTKTTEGKKISLNYRTAMEWMERKIKDAGASVIDGTLLQTDERAVRFKKNPHSDAHIYYRSRTYEGVLTVTDRERFTKMLTEGIGRQKAYGCGMMTVVPMHKGN